MAPLFRRREIWLPTWRGWLLILAATAALIAAYARLGYEWLAITEPAAGPGGQGAPVLVVEGWIPHDALDGAIALVRRGRYRQVVVSGGWSPLEPSRPAERTGERLRAELGPGFPVTVVPTRYPRVDRTHEAALAVRRVTRQVGIAMDSFDVFSYGPHARRSRQIYRMVFGTEAEVGVRAAPLEELAFGPWWRSSAGIKSVVGETFSIAWTTCCFWPDPEASR